MIKRPREHVLEEESRRAFEHVFPSEWVVRPQVPDYGLDAEVQIFKNQTATHLRFLAQLKSTDSSSKSRDSLKYRFSCRHLLYYRASAVPIMLAVYDAKQGIIFYNWVHWLFDELTSDERISVETQETITLHFKRKLTAGQHQSIEMELRHLYFQAGVSPVTLGVFKVNVSVHESTQALLPDQVQNQKAITDELQHWISSTNAHQFITLDSHEPDVALEVKLKERTAVLNHSGLGLHIEIPLPIEEVATPGDSTKQVVFFCKLLIVFLSSVARFSRAARDMLSDLITHEERLHSAPAVYFLHPVFASLFAQAGYAADALDLADFLLSRGHVDAATLLATAAPMQGMNLVLAQKHRRLLKSVLDRETSVTRKAIAHYNIAISLRQTGNHREAIFNYIKAASHDGQYYSRSYWWAEFAGCLFLTNKKRISAFCYRVARDLGETRIPVRVLLADVLLHLGKFEEALASFNEHANLGNHFSAEFQLKSWLAGFFATKFGNVHRQIGVALRTAQKTYTLPEKNQLPLLSEAVNLDPLCCYAWRNYAHFKGLESPEESSSYWLAAAILSSWDIETQFDAFVRLQSEGDAYASVLGGALLAEMYRVDKPRLKDELRKRSAIIKGGDSDEVERMVHETMEVARKMKEVFEMWAPDAPFVWRMFSTD